MDQSPQPTTLPLEGVSLTLFVTSIVCCVVSSLTVGLRTFVRFRDGAFSWDDTFMIAAAVVFVSECGLSAWAAQVGLGRRNADLDPYFMVQSTKYLMIWMLDYIFCLLLVKISVCLLLLRICGVRQLYRWAVWVLLAIVVGNFLTTFIGVCLLCRPIEANWNTNLVAEGKAVCAGMDAMIGLSYTSTATSIVTDLALAVLPGFMLWGTQMRPLKKLSVYVLLCIGSLASVSTIIRTPYISHYRNPMDDLAYYAGHIPIWSVIETAIGLISASVPSLRRLIMQKSPAVSHVSSNGHHSGRNPNSQPNQLLTFGSLPAHRGHGYRSQVEAGGAVDSVRGHSNGDWQRIQDSDNDSAKEKHMLEEEGGIRRDRTVTVELAPIGKQPKTSGNWIHVSRG